MIVTLFSQTGIGRGYDARARMGFPSPWSLVSRLLSKRQQVVSFDALRDDEDDAESWRGSMANSTEDWNRIQEGQRMLQLSTSLWYDIFGCTRCVLSRSCFGSSSSPLHD